MRDAMLDDGICKSSVPICKMTLFPEGCKLIIADTYRGVDKSLARPGRKQATATEDFDVHISYL
jgi:hypothetical protein